MQVNVLEAKNRLSELIRYVQSGTEVVIANRGRAVVRLALINPERPERPIGNAQSILEWLDEARPEWMTRQAEQTEADIAAARAAWD